MALDTHAKRQSVVSLIGPWYTDVGVPGGGVATGDRITLAHVYNGLPPAISVRGYWRKRGVKYAATFRRGL